MLKQIEDVVRRAGNMMLDLDNDLCITYKTSYKDLVTKYDKQIDQYLRETLSTIAPSAQFFTEEGENNINPYEGLTFIIDSIDGTVNFVKKLNHSCVSVGLVREGIPIIGVVYNPYTKEMFTAEVGCGAYCNNTIIRVGTAPISNSVVTFSTAPYDLVYTECIFEVAKRVNPLCIDLRITGSSALDLCDIARGVTGLSWSYSLYPWDYVGGSVIVSESGGVLCTLKREKLPLDKRSTLVAGNADNVSEFLSMK